MKKLSLLLLVAVAGAAAYVFWKRKSGSVVKTKVPGKSANPGSLQANKPAPPITTIDDWMIGKEVWDSIWSAVPTVDKGTAPGRWFDPEDTRQIYEENEAGWNVGDNYDVPEEFDPLESHGAFGVDKDGYLIP